MGNRPLGFLQRQGDEFQNRPAAVWINVRRSRDRAVLSTERRARIWFDRPAEYVAQPFAARSFEVKPKTRAKEYRRTVIVEMLVPAGGRFEYGLLGATVIDSGALTSEIAVEVEVTGASGPIFADSLAGTLDTVRWGLPAEYAEAVREGAREALLRDGAPAGPGIQFAWAAHGYVGSNSHRFRRLAALVVSLLVKTNDAERRDLVERA
jgi:hypothetical protein